MEKAQGRMPAQRKLRLTDTVPLSLLIGWRHRNSFLCLHHWKTTPPLLLLPSKLGIKTSVDRFYRSESKWRIDHVQSESLSSGKRTGLTRHGRSFLPSELHICSALLQATTTLFWQGSPPLDRARGHQKRNLPCLGLLSQCELSHPCMPHIFQEVKTFILSLFPRRDFTSNVSSSPHFFSLQIVAVVLF